MRNHLPLEPKLWPVMAVALVSITGATGGCGSSSAGRSRDEGVHVQPFSPVRRPRYDHLGTPACSDARDESQAHTCWRVAPSAGGKFVTISASCGISDRGLVECWKTDIAAVPAGKFDVIDDDGWNACAARTEGGVTCWGDAAWPTVPPSGKFTVLAVGGAGRGDPDEEGISACGLTAGGEIQCWGDGSPHWSGKLFLPGPFKSVDMGGGWVVAQTDDGRLHWFLGREEQELKKGGPYKTFSQNGGVSCQLLPSGRVECEGGVFYRAVLGASPPRDLTGIVMLRTGWDHACALEEDGDVRCWGDFRPPPKLKFRYISQPDHWDSYCGITIDEQTYCWGNPSRSPPKHLPPDSTSAARASQSARRGGLPRASCRGIRHNPARRGADSRGPPFSRGDSCRFG